MLGINFDVLTLPKIIYQMKIVNGYDRHVKMTGHNMDLLPSLQREDNYTQDVKPFARHAKIVVFSCNVTI